MVTAHREEARASAQGGVVLPTMEGAALVTHPDTFSASNSRRCRARGQSGRCLNQTKVYAGDAGVVPAGRVRSDGVSPLAREAVNGDPVLHHQMAVQVAGQIAGYMTPLIASRSLDVDAFRWLARSPAT